MRGITGLAIAVVLIGPAYGQSGPFSNSGFGPSIGTPSKNREEKEKLDPKQIDAAYKARMQQIPNRKIVTDPWQNVRTEKR
jgi:hypothetical protein